MTRFPVIQPGYQNPGTMQPGMQDRMPIDQHSAPGLPQGAIPAQPFGNDQRFQTPTSDFQFPGNLAELLGLKKGQLDKADPFQQSAFGRLLGMQDQLMGTLQNYGASAYNEVNQQFQTQQNNLTADLAARGLASSSLQAVGGLGLERERQSAMLQLSDQLLGKKFDVVSQIGSSLAELLAGIGSANQAASNQKDLLRMQQDSVGIGAGVMSQKASQGGLGQRKKYGLGAGAL